MENKKIFIFETPYDRHALSEVIVIASNLEEAVEKVVKRLTDEESIPLDVKELAFLDEDDFKKEILKFFQGNKIPKYKIVEDLDNFFYFKRLSSKRRTCYGDSIIFCNVGITTKELIDVVKYMFKNMIIEFWKTKNFVFKEDELGRRRFLESSKNFLLVPVAGTSYTQFFVWFAEEAILYHEGYEPLKIPQGIYFVVILR